MVKHLNTEDHSAAHKPPCDCDISIAGRRVAAGMVVNKNDPSAIPFHTFPKDLPGWQELSREPMETVTKSSTLFFAFKITSFSVPCPGSAFLNHQLRHITGPFI